MIKRLSVLLGTAAFLGSIGGMTAFAANITGDQARDAASAYAPSGSTYLSTDTDDNSYEVKYYSQTSGEIYEFKVSQAEGKLLAFESKRFEHHGGSSVNVSESDAKNQVTAEISGAEIISVLLEQDDGMVYEIRFRTDSLYGKYTIHTETGSILEREIKIGTGAPTNVSDSSGSAQGSLLSREQAIDLAKKQVSSAAVTDVDLEYEDGRYKYEVELYKDSTEYKITLDAVTGAVISSRTETEDWSWYNTGSSDGTQHVTDIGMEKAKQIALSKVPGATVRKLKRDYDDGRLIYEGELYKDGWEYEFEIDGATGSILEWEKDND